MSGIATKQERLYPEVLNIACSTRIDVSEEKLEPKLFRQAKLKGNINLDNFETKQVDTGDLEHPVNIAESNRLVCHSEQANWTKCLLLRS